jgi:DNA polymerase III subunit epsilon
MKILNNNTYAIVDIETTGGSPTTDRIIEVGIIRIEKGKVAEVFESLINPQKHVPASIQMITGINPEELLGAPTFEDISDKIFNLLDGAVFVAHNARFDYGFLKNELRRYGTNFSAKTLCTVKLSRKLFPEERKHDLSSVIERLDLTCKARHRALGDAEALRDLFIKLESLGRVEETRDALQKILKENSIPQFMDREMINTLPEGPGVYKFYGEDGEVLYIGKSKNVKERVMSHFASDHASSKEMHLCQQTVRIEAESTAGELGALLLESKRIKELSPVYNRVLRRRSELVVAFENSKNGYTTLSLERVRSIEPHQYKKVLGIFKNLAQAKSFLSASREEYGLCSKLINLEKGKGACFYHGLGKCEGACIEKEEAKEYNERVKKAFKARRLRAWPFKGPILIEERKSDEEKQSFILDNWCLLNEIKTDGLGAEVTNLSPEFDYDSYKIILRYIKDPLNKKRIRPMSYQALQKNLEMIESI